MSCFLNLWGVWWSLVFISCFRCYLWWRKRKLKLKFFLDWPSWVICNLHAKMHWHMMIKMQNTIFQKKKNESYNQSNIIFFFLKPLRYIFQNAFIAWNYEFIVKFEERKFFFFRNQKWQFTHFGNTYVACQLFYCVEHILFTVISTFMHLKQQKKSSKFS